MPSIATRSPAPTIVQDSVVLPPDFPDLPDDVLKRFPSLNGWEEDTDQWWNTVASSIQENNQVISQTTTQARQNIGDLRVSIAGATAAITTETIARITADEILAQRIVTVSAIAGVAQNITIQGTAPVSPSVNDYWVDNTSLLNPITYQWDGAMWNEVTQPITVAAVAAEQTARITADGNLSGKYTLTVIAGNVVTGMNITSSTGGGTNISSVIFRATDFQIYNGTSGITMFSVSGSTVNLAGTLTVSTSGKVFIGVGTYANANTAWYVDSSGQFSLKDKLTWDGTTLGVNGTIVGSAGFFGNSTNAVSINSAGLRVGNAGAIAGGQTAYNTGTGFWMGFQAGAYGFSIGNPAGNYMLWNGTNLFVNGGSTPNFVTIDTTGFTVGVSGGQRAFIGTLLTRGASVGLYNSAGTLVSVWSNVSSTRQQLIMIGDPASGFTTVQLDTNAGAGGPSLIMTNGTNTTTFEPNKLSFGPVASQQTLTASAGVITVANAFTTNGVLIINAAANINGLLTFTSVNFAVSTGSPAGGLSDYISAELNGVAGFIPWYAA